MRLLVAAAAASVLVGCPDRSITELDPRQSGVYTKDILVSADLDVLFVIDDSRSTLDKQQLFAQNYRNFVTRLAGFPTRPNLHLGVVTSSIDIGVDAVDGERVGAQCHPASGTNGLLQGASRDPALVCKPTSDRFLVDVARPDGTRLTNYSGTLEDALSCISHVGDSGCGFESPLEAMKRALDGSRPENAGFLRRGAFLAVVILADEDDCSADRQLFQLPAATVGATDFRCTSQAYECDQPISPSAPRTYTGCAVRRTSYLTDPGRYAEFLSGLKGPSRVAVAVIAGPPSTTLATGPLGVPVQQDFTLQPTCMTTIGTKPAVGRPAIRIDEFRRRFGDRGLFRTVCESDYSEAVGAIGDLLFRALSPCLEGELDTRDIDPSNPGLQPDCTVSDLQDTDTDAPIETLIPRCRMRGDEQPELGDDPACWWVKADVATCTTETQLELQVERRAAPPPDTTVRVSCAKSPAELAATTR